MSAEWEALLARFEADLAADIPTASWAVPLDPLPPELAERARHLLVGQQDRIRRLREDLDHVQRQRDAVSRVPAGGSRPAYLDVTG